MFLLSHHPMVVNKGHHQQIWMVMTKLEIVITFAIPGAHMWAKWLHRPLAQKQLDTFTKSSNTVPCRVLFGLGFGLCYAHDCLL